MCSSKKINACTIQTKTVSNSYILTHAHSYNHPVIYKRAHPQSYICGLWENKIYHTPYTFFYLKLIANEHMFLHFLSDESKTLHLQKKLHFKRWKKSSIKKRSISNCCYMWSLWPNAKCTTVLVCVVLHGKHYFHTQYKVYKIKTEKFTFMRYCIFGILIKHSANVSHWSSLAVNIGCFLNVPSYLISN